MKKLSFLLVIAMILSLQLISIIPMALAQAKAEPVDIVCDDPAHVHAEASEDVCMHPSLPWTNWNDAKHWFFCPLCNDQVANNHNAPWVTDATTHSQKCTTGYGCTYELTAKAHTWSSKSEDPYGIWWQVCTTCGYRDRLN